MHNQDSEAIWSEPFKPNHSEQEVLVIQCCDGRFVDATHRFLHDHLGLQNYDLISVPGAVHFLVSDLLPKFPWVARKWLKFLIDHHHTREVLIFQHRDCGWYKFMNGIQTYTDKLRGKQNDDTSRTEQMLREMGAEVKVRHYFVDFGNDTVSICTL